MYLPSDHKIQAKMSERAICFPKLEKTEATRYCEGGKNHELIRSGSFCSSEQKQVSKKYKDF
jgi:hypothetical protein